MSRYPTVRVKKREGRRARSGAPWIFSNEIETSAVTKALGKGVLVDVVGADDHIFGTGYFNPASLIAVRLLTAQTAAPIDAAFFAERIERALRLRERFAGGPFYRLIHAEGDGLPGLTVDRFADTLVVQIATAGMEALKAPMLAALEAVLHPKNILIRADMPSRALEGLDSYVTAVKGTAGKIDIVENGVTYRADLSAGQKTGWYYDLREPRAFMAGLAPGGTMLDAYCYCGGFALAAAKAGARAVTGVDSSGPALALAEDAARAQALAATFVEADAMAKLEALAESGARFDVVIADPPPFVRSRKDLEAGARAYRRLARLAAAVTAKDGFLFLASCSHNMPADRFALECAGGLVKAGRGARLIRAGGAGYDHPIQPALPESAYLKWQVYALD